MSNVKFITDGKGTYGFFVPATTPDTLIDKALNFGVNVQNADGSVNFQSAETVTGL
jgi:hypothetical protein